MAAVTRSRFYPLFALALALVVFVGFARTFYLRQWFDVPPITALLFLHGLVFSMWVAVYVIQTRLIAAHQVRAHMRLGIAGLALAALVVIIGFATACVSANETRPRPMGMASNHFAFIPVFILIAFSSLVTAAVALRWRPELHRRLMTLAMITILPPATARLIMLTGARGHFLELQTTVTAVFVFVCLAGDWIKHRTVHPVYAVGGVLLVVSWPFRVWVAQSEAWGHAGTWMAKLGTFLIS